jgi:DNA-binding HxlR family transcriptional regulator
MTARTYAQYCGLAYALDLVGERWALLIVRDLLLGPRRFTDLRRGLPGIPTNVLSARLKELEENGIVLRRVLPRPATGVAYDLTDYGRGLEDVVLRLGLWGARSLGRPHAGDVVTPAALAVALRASFQPEAARGLRAAYEVHVGDAVVHARVDRGSVDVAEGPLAGADVVLEADQILRSVMAGEVSVDDAIEVGGLRATGDPALVARFQELFRLPPPR